MLLAVDISARRKHSSEPSAGPPSLPGVVVWHGDGLEYSYHVLTGTEALFDLKEDPRRLVNLAESRKETTRRLRAELEAHLRVRSLDELRQADKEKIARLRSLGYLH
ncbi:MAG: hypothetical protein U0166_16060 [Acidobacteriota bacterium]